MTHVRELIHLLRGHAQTDSIKSESIAQVEIRERHAGRSEAFAESAEIVERFFKASASDGAKH
jgi:hypothetical protein